MTEEQLIEKMARAQRLISEAAKMYRLDQPSPDQLQSYLDESDQLLSDALAVVRESEGWQPIDTAPKDGTCVDLYRPDRIGGGGRVCVGHYNNDMYARKGPRPFWETQYGGLGRIYDRDNPPSHWRPRPAPPKTEGED